jgi:hypothetical protein
MRTMMMMRMIAIKMINKASHQLEAPLLQSFLPKFLPSLVPNSPAPNSSVHKNQSPSKIKPTSRMLINGNTTAKTPTVPIRTSHISIDN